MASSGVFSYTYTANQIINAALRKLSVLSEGVSANTTQLETGLEALNLLVLELQALGMQVWSRKQVTTTLVSGTSSYTISAPKALKIVQAWRTHPTTSERTDIMVVPDYDFNLLPPTATGVPINVTYQPRVGSGTLKVWPTPDSSMATGMTLTLVYISESEVFTLGTQTPDIPQEWYNTVVYQLAVLLAHEYGVPVQDISSLEKQADKHLNTVLGLATEDGSIYFQPSRD
jgi:hypothetical protein